MRTVNQINSEIYSLIEYKDTKPARKILLKEFPKCKGEMSRLTAAELEKLLIMLKEIYKDA